MKDLKEQLKRKGGLVDTEVTVDGWIRKGDKVELLLLLHSTYSSFSLLMNQIFLSNYRIIHSFLQTKLKIINGIQWMLMQ